MPDDLSSQFFNVNTALGALGAFAGSGGNALSALAAIGSSGLLNSNKPKTPDTGSTIGALTSFTSGMQQGANLSRGISAGMSSNSLKQINDSLHTVVSRLETTNSLLQKIIDIQTGVGDINYQKTIRRNNRLALLMSKTAMGRLTLAAMSRAAGVNMIEYENMTRGAVEKGVTTHQEIMTKKLIDMIPMFGNIMSGFNFLSNKILQTKSDYTNESNLSLTQIIPNRLKGLVTIAHHIYNTSQDINKNTTTLVELMEIGYYNLETIQNQLANYFHNSETIYNTTYKHYQIQEKYYLSHLRLIEDEYNFRKNYTYRHYKNAISFYEKTFQFYLEEQKYGKKNQYGWEVDRKYNEKFIDLSNDDKKYKEYVMNDYFNKTLGYQTNVLLYLKLISDSIFDEAKVDSNTKKVTKQIHNYINNKDGTSQDKNYWINFSGKIKRAKDNKFLYNNSTLYEKYDNDQDKERERTGIKWLKEEDEDHKGWKTFIDFKKWDDLFGKDWETAKLDQIKEYNKKRAKGVFKNRLADKNFLDDIQKNYTTNLEAENKDNISVYNQINLLRESLKEIMEKKEDKDGNPITEEKRKEMIQNISAMLPAILEKTKIAKTDKEAKAKYKEESQRNNDIRDAVTNSNKSVTDILKNTITLRATLINISTKLPQLGSKIASSAIKLMMGFGTFRMLYKLLTSLTGGNTSTTGISGILNNTLGANSITTGLSNLGGYIKDFFQNTIEKIKNSETYKNLKSFIYETLQAIWPTIKEYLIKGFQIGFKYYSLYKFPMLMLSSKSILIPIGSFIIRKTGSLIVSVSDWIFSKLGIDNFSEKLVKVFQSPILKKIFSFTGKIIGGLLNNIGLIFTGVSFFRTIYQWWESTLNESMGESFKKMSTREKIAKFIVDGFTFIISKGWEGIKFFFKDIIPALWDAAKRIVSNIWDWILGRNNNEENSISAALDAQSRKDEQEKRQNNKDEEEKGKKEKTWKDYIKETWDAILGTLKNIGKKIASIINIMDPTNIGTGFGALKNMGRILLSMIGYDKEVKEKQESEKNTMNDLLLSLKTYMETNSQTNLKIAKILDMRDKGKLKITDLGEIISTIKDAKIDGTPLEKALREISAEMIKNDLNKKYWDMLQINDKSSIEDIIQAIASLEITSNNSLLKEDLEDSNTKVVTAVNDTTTEVKTLNESLKPKIEENKKTIFHLMNEGIWKIKENTDDKEAKDILDKLKNLENTDRFKPVTNWKTDENDAFFNENVRSEIKNTYSRNQDTFRANEELQNLVNRYKEKLNEYNNDKDIKKLKDDIDVLNKHKNIINMVETDDIYKSLNNFIYRDPTEIENQINFLINAYGLKQLEAFGENYKFKFKPSDELKKSIAKKDSLEGENLINYKKKYNEEYLTSFKQYLTNIKKDIPSLINNKQKEVNDKYIEITKLGSDIQNLLSSENSNISIKLRGYNFQPGQSTTILEKSIDAEQSLIQSDIANQAQSWGLSNFKHAQIINNNDSVLESFNDILKSSNDKERLQASNKLNTSLNEFKNNLNISNINEEKISVKDLKKLIRNNYNKFKLIDYSGNEYSRSKEVKDELLEIILSSQNLKDRDNINKEKANELLKIIKNSFMMMHFSNPAFSMGIKSIIGDNNDSINSILSAKIFDPDFNTNVSNIDEMKTIINNGYTDPTNIFSYSYNNFFKRFLQNEKNINKLKSNNIIAYKLIEDIMHLYSDLGGIYGKEIELLKDKTFKGYYQNGLKIKDAEKPIELTNRYDEFLTYLKGLTGTSTKNNNGKIELTKFSNNIDTYPIQRYNELMESGDSLLDVLLDPSTWQEYYKDGWKDFKGQQSWSKYIYEAAKETGIDPELLSAMIMNESSGRLNVYSKTRAGYGLFQLHQEAQDDTHRLYSNTKIYDRMDPTGKGNIFLAAYYLKAMIDGVYGKRYGYNNVKQFLTAYNAGPSKGNINTPYFDRTMRYYGKHNFTDPNMPTNNNILTELSLSTNTSSTKDYTVPFSNTDNNFYSHDHLSIVVDKHKQKLYLYKGTNLIKTYTTSTGLNPGNKEKEGDMKTPVGTFPIIQIEDGLRKDKNGRYGPHFFRLDYKNPGSNKNAGIAIHGTNQPEMLGKPASHGCIRISNDNVKELKKYVYKNMPVHIFESVTDKTIGDILTNKINMSRKDIEENAKKYLTLNANVDFKGVNPELQKRVINYAIDFSNKYPGKKVILTSGFRSIEKQRELYNAYKTGKSKYPAAQPGHSRHNYGFAVDMSVKSGSIDTELLKKNGLIQPYPVKDPVHIEGIEWAGKPLSFFKNYTPAGFDINNANNNSSTTNTSGFDPSKLSNFEKMFYDAGAYENIASNNSLERMMGMIKTINYYYDQQGDNLLDTKVSGKPNFYNTTKNFNPYNSIYEVGDNPLDIVSSFIPTNIKNLNNNSNNIITSKKKKEVNGVFKNNQLDILTMSLPDISSLKALALESAGTKVLEKQKLLDDKHNEELIEAINKQTNSFNNLKNVNSQEMMIMFKGFMEIMKNMQQVNLNNSNYTTLNNSSSVVNSSSASNNNPNSNSTGSSINNMSLQALYC